MVTCSGQVETTIAKWEVKEICTIPEGFRPMLDKTDNTFINITGNGKMTAYGQSGEYPNKLYAMAINAVTSNSIVFGMSWVTNE